MLSKREAVLETAERLFYAEGFHATGIDRVVTEAGVARMTLYNHFPSKEALIEAVLTRRYGRYLGELRHAIEAAGQDAAVMALVERHAAWIETVSDRGCIVMKAIRKRGSGAWARAVFGASDGRNGIESTAPAPKRKWRRPSCLTGTRSSLQRTVV